MQPPLTGSYSSHLCPLAERSGRPKPADCNAFPGVPSTNFTKASRDRLGIYAHSC